MQPRARLPLASSCEDADPGAPRARGVERRRHRQRRPPGRGLSPTGSEQARALGRALAAEPIDLGVSSRLQRTRRRSSSRSRPRAPAPRRAAPRRDRLRLVRGRPARRVPQLGLEHGPTPPARAAARAARRSQPGSLMASRRCSRGPRRRVLAVSHGLPVRYVLDAADGRFPRRVSSRCRTPRPTGSSGRASSGRSRRCARGRQSRASRDNPLVDDERGAVRPMHTLQHDRAAFPCPARGPRGSARRRGSRVRWLRRRRSRADELHPVARRAPPPTRRSSI